jgi:cytoskeletal protein CcmA (bactofilin family)
VQLAKGKSGNTGPQPAPAVPAPTRAPSVPLQISGYGEQDSHLVARASSLNRTGATPAAHKDPPRTVRCYECDAIHRVAGASTSTICPSCSTYIDLRDIEIKDRTNQRIRTRGNVTVQKKGALLGTSIHCGNLTVHGTASGSIYASGEVQFKDDQKIIGEVRCGQLVIDKKCEVQFLQPVHAGDVEISGQVTGHFYATGSIILHRGASLSGSATARTLTVEPGAMLNGQIAVQRPSARQESGDLGMLGGGLLPVAG